MNQQSSQQTNDYGVAYVGATSGLFNLGVNGAIYELTKWILEYTLRIYELDIASYELSKATYDLNKATYDLTLESEKHDEVFYKEAINVLNSIDNRLKRMEEKSN